MSFDAYFRFGLGLLAVLLLVLAAYALWTGRVAFARELYVRSERPADYWRELMLLVLSPMIVLGWLLFVPVPADREPSYGAMFLFAIVGPLVLRAVWLRRIEFGNNRFTPRKRPGPYWTILLFGIALLGLGIAVLVNDLRL